MLNVIKYVKNERIYIMNEFNKLERYSINEKYYVNDNMLLIRCKKYHFNIINSKSSGSSSGFGHLFFTIAMSQWIKGALPTPLKPDTDKEKTIIVVEEDKQEYLDYNETIDYLESMLLMNKLSNKEE